MSYTLTPYQPMALQSLATTGTGGALILRGNCERVTFQLDSVGTTSGGTITLEEAFWDIDTGKPVYAGTWSAIVPAISASTFTGTASVTVHATGSFWAVRARISSDITGGGTVNVWAWGN